MFVLFRVQKVGVHAAPGQGDQRWPEEMAGWLREVFEGLQAGVLRSQTAVEVGVLAFGGDWLRLE